MSGTLNSSGNPKPRSSRSSRSSSSSTALEASFGIVGSGTSPASSPASSLSGGQLETVFMTVGTTEFDQLLATIDSTSSENSFFESLLRLGCRRFILQTGKTGVYRVSNIERRCAELGIEVEIFNLKPSLLPYMQAADLVISHCGAGSVLEACSFKKKLVVVVNESLQGNHQVELADALSELKYCFKAYPHTIVSLIQDWSYDFKSVNGGSKTCKGAESRGDEFCLETYPQPDLTAFPRVVDSLFEWV